MPQSDSEAPNVKGPRDSMVVAETVSTSATKAIFTDDMVDAAAFWRAYAGERKPSPAQLLWLELLWITISDLEKGDIEAYCWVRGDYDRELRWLRTRLGDVLTYCGLDAHRSLAAWRLALLAKYGTRGTNGHPMPRRAFLRHAVPKRIGSTHRNRVGFWESSLKGR